MKKLLIISAVTIMFLMLGFSGCFDNSNKENGENSGVNVFIGRWSTIIYYYAENGTRYDEKSSNTTFYTNGTMGSESVEGNETIWTPYALENNQICIGTANDTEYLCYNYNFTDETHAKLWTYVTNPYSEEAENYLLVIELRKN